VAASWQMLTAPVELAAIDLLSPSVKVDTTAQLPVVHDGRLDGSVIHFELELDDAKTISTKPGAAGADCHWLCPVWVLPRRMPVSTGEVLTVRYRHDLSRTTLSVTRGG
jgi:hypothetical protein